MEQHGGTDLLHNIPAQEDVLLLDRDMNWQFHGRFCFHRAGAALRTPISIFDGSVEHASSYMERRSYHSADNFWPLSLINGRHRI